MVRWTCGERLICEDGLYGIKKDAVVAVDVLADGVYGNASVCDAQVCQDGSGLHERLLAALILDSAGVQ